MAHTLVRRQPCEDTETQGEHHIMTKVENGIVQIRVKECQRLPANHQNLERGEDESPYRFQRKHGPTDTLILDF